MGAAQHDCSRTPLSQVLKHPAQHMPNLQSTEQTHTSHTIASLTGSPDLSLPIQSAIQASADTHQKLSLATDRCCTTRTSLPLVKLNLKKASRVTLEVAQLA